MRKWEKAAGLAPEQTSCTVWWISVVLVNESGIAAVVFSSSSTGLVSSTHLTSAGYSTPYASVRHTSHSSHRKQLNLAPGSPTLNTENSLPGVVSDG